MIDNLFYIRQTDVTFLYGRISGPSVHTLKSQDPVEPQRVSMSRRLFSTEDRGPGGEEWGRGRTCGHPQFETDRGLRSLSEGNRQGDRITTSVVSTSYGNPPV